MTFIFLPVNALVVVVAVEELNFLERPGAGQVADDGRVHEKEQIESRCAWHRGGGGRPNGSKRRDTYYFSRIFAQKVTFKRPVLSRVRMVSLKSVSIFHVATAYVSLCCPCS